MSNSAIGFIQIVYGPTGPTGARGRTGPTGPAGLTTDVLGNIGPLAPHISNIQFSGSGATVYFSNNETLSVSGSFGGVTGTNSAKVVSVDPFDINVDTETHKFVGVGNNTSTFVMRGISASGSLVVSEDSQAIYIDSIYNAESGSADSATLTDNTLVYLKKNNQISSTVIGITSGTFYDGTLVFKKDSANLDFSKLLPRAKVKYIHPTYNTPNAEPVLLNVEDAGVFYIRTPNGISGFSGLMRPNEVTSVTLITESDDIWSFPKNVYFENGENYLTCGKSILNLTTFDQGQSWYAVVAARGIDGSTANCEVKSLYGSCCYQGLTALLCKDFITKNECDILSGTFNALVSCDVGCGSTFGVCCSNGSCIENVSYSECIAFGGKYFFGIDCNYLNNNPNGDNDTRLCFNNCSTQKIACCKDGQCLGDNFTKIECENILGGVAFVNKQCSEVDCCLQNVKVGPCCFDGNCIETTLLDCKTNFNGIFLGEGERCGNVNCSCYDTTNAIFGRCCICNGSTPTCIITTQSGCPNNSWEQVPGAVFNDTCSPQNQNFCTANLSCAAPTGRCCVCSGGSTTCSIKTQAECSALNGIWNSTLTCATSCNPCTFTPPCADCSSGGTPGVICECVTDGSGTRKVCSSIQTNDSRCSDPNVVCIPNVNCSSNPCGAGNILPGCVTNTCPGGATEQQTCPQTADIRTSSICPDCFPDGTIPALSGVIEHNSSNSADGFVLEPIRDIWADFATNLVFQDGTDVSNPCRQAVGANNPIVGKVLYANSVKDVYIPIKPEYICPNGKDLQFCIQIDLPDTQLIQSFRAYILRTWYPNNFSTNYAASRGKILIGGRPVNFIDPASISEEINVWGSIEDVEGLQLFNDGYQTLSRMKYAENLSSVLTEKSFNYIEYNPNYDDYVFNYTNLIPSFNVNTVRMIHELNCPLLGYNPRGRYIEFERATSTNPLIPPTGNPRPLLATRQNPGITYARVDDHTNQYYYSSVNLGGRCGVAINSNPNDSLLLDPIDGQVYNTDNLSRFSFSSKARRYENDFSDTTLPGAALDSRRTMGYTDLGFAKTCLIQTTGFTLCEYLTVDSVIDPSGIDGIGFYPRHATLNRFANTFTNFAFTTPGNPPVIADLLPYRFSNPGHPLMVDYESDIVVLQESGGGFPPSTIKKHVYRYDPYNSQPIPGTSVSFTNETTVTSNTFNDVVINKSPIYKTRHTSIICDTGVYDNAGNYYEDTAFTYGNMATPQYSPKRKILGAIDNPWYDNPTVPGSSSRAETVISKTPTGYKLCIKLKNYKDYILTDDQLNTSDFSPYGVLKNTTISRNKRHLLYKNTLRVVLFANPLNPYTNTIFGTDPIANPPGTPNVPQDDPDIVLATYKKAAEEYTKLYYFFTILTNGQPDTFNYNKLKYGCTNSSCACGSSENLEGKCNACNINQFDKQTNMYGAYTARTFYCTMRGFHSFGAYDEAGCARIVTEDGGGGGGGSGLGSYLVCNCASTATCPVAEFQQDFPVVANCRNCSHPTPCSCKGVSPSGTVYYGGGYAGCFGAQPCGQIVGQEATKGICEDNCSESAHFETSILGITFPWEGGCVCPSTICGFTGQDTSGFYQEPSFSGRMRLIRRYFDALGYVENEDYIVVNYDPPIIPETMVIFKLFSKFYPNLNNLPPHERYSFTHIAPPYLAYERRWDSTSVWPNVNLEGQGPADYIRDTICLGSAAGASLAEYIQTCGIGITLFATRLYNGECSNFCELNGQSCVPKLFDGTDQQFYSNLLAHTLYLPPPQPANRAIAMGASCPTGSFTGSDTYKKFFIDETDFICVNVDCSTIDCSQYQDCSP